MTVNVKICGLTNLSDAQCALDAGADLLGFIFYPKSPRFVPPERAREILASLERTERPIHTVGVFVNTGLDEVCQTLDFCGLDLAQLHGDEPPEWLSAPSPLAGRAYKALRPQTPEKAAAGAERYALPTQAPALLVDAYHPTQPGGTGITGDWASAADLARQYPLLLAGGLTPANVQAAIHSVHPWGVDVSSGVESAPGIKDHEAVYAFIHAVKHLPQMNTDITDKHG